MAKHLADGGSRNRHGADTRPVICKGQPETKRLKVVGYFEFKVAPYPLKRLVDLMLQSA
jgi:hypothetical protein